MPSPGPRVAQAKRTKEVLPIVRAAKRVLLLSGTPALNRPKELYPQVRVGRISFEHHLACPECGILSWCSQTVAKAQSAQHLCRAASPSATSMLQTLHLDCISGPPRAAELL